jgi:hypothetical protein
MWDGSRSNQHGWAGAGTRYETVAPSNVPRVGPQWARKRVDADKVCGICLENRVNEPLWRRSKLCRPRLSSVALAIATKSRIVGCWKVC